MLKPQEIFGSQSRAFRQNSKKAEHLKALTKRKCIISLKASEMKTSILTIKKSLSNQVGNKIICYIHFQKDRSTYQVALALPCTVTFRMGIQVPLYSKAGNTVAPPPIPSTPGLVCAAPVFPDALLPVQKNSMIKSSNLILVTSQHSFSVFMNNLS